MYIENLFKYVSQNRDIISKSTAVPTCFAWKPKVRVLYNDNVHGT